MNTGLATKAKATYSSRTRTDTTITAPDHLEPIAPVSSAPRLLTQPSEKWDTKAISHFLHNYSFAPTKDGPGYLGFLPGLLANNSSVESAVLAAGFASLANVTGLSYLERTAEKHYGETLRSISIALKDPSEASSDTTLAAIIVLQLYEAIIGITSVSRDPHEKGLVALARQRGNARPSTGSGNDLLRIIYSRVHINSVGGISPSPVEAEYDVEAVDFPTHQNELWRLMRETSRFCAETQAIMAVPGNYLFKSKIIESLDRLFSAYLRLLSWRAALPSTWLYQSCKVPTRDEQDSEQRIPPGKYHLFRNIHHGGMWISFWCTLIYALQTLVYVSTRPMIQQTFAQSLHRTQDLRNRLHDAVDEICACVPYMMADVDQLGLPTVGKDGKALGSYFLLRGLYVASCVEELTSAQRECMTRTFLRIAHVKGIKLALRPTNRWLCQHGGRVASVHQLWVTGMLATQDPTT
ncbi:hypothetical protein EKO27_g4180 [Xylaria grammica]|uniref:Transcription factor domain-containing protein n=1 Tax=Xylaria grammica TaxID=363999 RepID=A0A439D940_9PEZI|nr:hypothetical protein EKO27_g4180 [Xylaria grammica]